MSLFRRFCLLGAALPSLAYAQVPHGGIAAPLTAPAASSTPLPLTDLEKLGKELFFDKTLSNPAGYSCATCHLPAAGFTGPSSAINLVSGPQPGVVLGRYGHRKPQAVPYSTFSPPGPFFYASIEVWMGGNFWDGRALDNAAQARMPFIDPDEMANLPTGPYPPHTGGFSALLTTKLPARPYAMLFRSVYGANVFGSATPADLYTDVVKAIAAYEATAEVNPFSSKFDYSVHGVPGAPEIPDPGPAALPTTVSYTFTAAEERGRVLFFSDAQCFQCHSSATLQPVLDVTGNRDSFTMYCYANVGVPKNPHNPFYRETSSASNPHGYNPAGAAFIDYGLGGNPNPSPTLGTPNDGTLFMNQAPGDIPDFRGLFKAPSVRNVDKRPSPGFVKAYMHNGVFKSLEQVVHFYNKRNIAVDRFGREVAFDLRVGPPKGYTRLFPPPEVMDNVQNASGVTPAEAGDDVDNNGQVGHLGLSARQEADLVAFLKTLTDGFGPPQPVARQ